MVIKRFSQSKIANEEGSMIIESAIIFPLIMLIVLILITFSIIIHDLYVSRLLIDFIGEESQVISLNHELENRVIGNYIVDISNSGHNHSNTIKFDIPFVEFDHFEYGSIKYHDDLIKRVMLVEMTSDIFDDLTMRETTKDKYKKLIKSVIAGLEND